MARLSIEGAPFWLSGDSAGHAESRPAFAGGGPIRLIVTVPDPDTLFAQALAAGAVEVFPVTDEHGWRIGRLVDPFGYHWEIGRPTTTE